MKKFNIHNFITKCDYENSHQDQNQEFQEKCTNQQMLEIQKEIQQEPETSIENYYNKDKLEDRMKFLQRIKAISSFNSSNSRRKLSSQQNTQRCTIKTFNFTNGNIFKFGRGSIPDNTDSLANKFIDNERVAKFKITKFRTNRSTSQQSKKNTNNVKLLQQQSTGQNIDIEKFLYDLTTNRQISTPIAACSSHNNMCTYSESKLLKSLKKKQLTQKYKESCESQIKPKLQVSDLVYCKFKKKTSIS